jgi:hypothetical protein
MPNLFIPVPAVPGFITRFDVLPNKPAVTKVAFHAATGINIS